MEPATHHPTQCRNCGEPLSGRYCYRCGQDSQDHQESVWQLLKHFFEDLTHYDGKLWHTVQPLLIRPGFLTQEFLQGKRAGYLNPVRLFIFLNFIFFLLVITLPDAGPQGGPLKIVDNHDRDTTARKTIAYDTVSTHELKNGKYITLRPKIEYSSISEYDSAQQTLAPDKRDGRFTRAFTQKWITLSQMVRKDPRSVQEKANELFLHNSAKLTFLFIIICSCLLYLLYYRRHIFMINHALFSIHLGCTFLLLSVLMLFVSYLPYGNFIAFAIFLYGSYYFFRALRVVYGQSFSKTAWKFVVINIFLAIGMLTGVLINVVFTLMTLKS